MFEAVEFDPAGDSGHAGLVVAAPGEVAGFLRLAGAGPERKEDGAPEPHTAAEIIPSRAATGASARAKVLVLRQPRLVAQQGEAAIL
jgi:hypothetical protein